MVALKNYKLEGICSRERISAIDKINQVIGRHATLINFQRFSDLSIGFTLQAEEGALEKLLHELQNIISIESSELPQPGSKAPCIVLMNVIFTGGTGDLEHEIPDIPD